MSRTKRPTIGVTTQTLQAIDGIPAGLPTSVVMNQRYYITPLLTRDLVGSFVQPQEVRRPIYQLTPRQREVLQLLAEGHSMKQAAAILNVSPRTIAFHKYRMMEHLRVQSTAALVHFAVREGLI